MQTLPTVKHGDRPEIVDETVINSRCCNAVRKFTPSKNVRVHGKAIVQDAD